MCFLPKNARRREGGYLCWMLARDKSKDDDFRIPVGDFTPRDGRGRKFTDKTLIKNTFNAHKFNNQQNM